MKIELQPWHHEDCDQHHGDQNPENHPTVSDNRTQNRMFRRTAFCHLRGARNVGP